MVNRTQVYSVRPAEAAQLDRAVLQQNQAVSRVATRYDKLAENYLAFIKLASIQI
jgi:transposase